MESGSGFRICNLCGSTESQLLFNKDGYPIVRCQRCDMVFVGESLDQIDFGDLYGESYYTGGNDKVFEDYLGQERGRRALARRKLWSLRRLVPHGKLLDVGCAAGFFLVEAQRHYEVHGVELSEFSSKFAREHLGLNVFNGTLLEAALPSGHFDLVTLWDVIEHVPNPREVLAEVSRVLKPGGHIILTTGDVGCAYAQARGPDWHLMGPPWHLYYFSRITMAHMAREAGLQVSDCAAHGTFSDHPLLKQRIVRVAANFLGFGDIMQMTLTKPVV